MNPWEVKLRPQVTRLGVSATLFLQFCAPPDPERWYHPVSPRLRGVALSFKMAAAIAGLLLADRHRRCWTNVSFSRSWTWIRLGGWEGQWTALGQDWWGKWGRKKAVRLWMGEGASRPSGRARLRLRPGLCAGTCPPGLRLRPSGSSPAEILSLERQWLLRGSKAPDL